MDLELEANRRGVELRILVTRLRYLGDVILTTPAVKALKKRYPTAEIYYLAENPYGEILEANPYIEKVFSIGTGFFDMLETIGQLRKLNLLAVVDLFYNPRSAWICFLSNLPIRLGGSRKWRRRFYTKHFYVPGGVKSAIMHHMYALRSFDVDIREEMPRVYLRDDEVDEASRFINDLIPNSNGRPLIAVHPGAKWQSKRWKTEYFIELIRKIEEELDANVLILTGPGEEELSFRVAAMSKGSTYILPIMPIRKTAAIISLCNVLVANDGGIVHLSVALGVATIALFGPTNPDIWFPYTGKGPYEVLTLRKHCSPCDLHYCENRSCMDDMTPDYVFHSLKEVVLDVTQ